MSLPICRLWLNVAWLLVFTTIASQPASAQTVFTKTATFSALRLSYEDLSDLLTKTHRLINAANASTECSQSGSVTVEGELSSLEVEGDFSVERFANSPATAYSVFYMYTCRDAPVSEVRLYFVDSIRKITVSGSDRGQVEALSAMLSENLRQHETRLGGFRFRQWAGLVLLVIGYLMTFGSWGIRSPTRWLVFIGGLLFMTSTWLFPWDKWLPGTVVLNRDAEFLIKYGPQISFVGAMATLLGILMSAWLALSKRNAA